MSRGDRREAIFRDNEDYRSFLETLDEMCKRTGIRIHAYALMGNHYHVLLETPEPNLVAGMKWLQGAYTQRFNRRHQLNGHLFQGRYKAIPVQVEGGDYVRTLSTYIHLNPARAGLLDSKRPELATYRWSSFPKFVQDAVLPAWLVRSRVFTSHGLPDEGRGSRRRYAALMARRVAEEIREKGAEDIAEKWKAIRRGWYIGDDAFRDQLMDRADRLVRGRRRASYRREGLHLHDEREAVRLLEQAATQLGVSVSALWSRKQTDPVKQAVAWWVKGRSVVSDDWLSAKLEMGSRTNIHRAVRAFRVIQDPTRAKLKSKLQLCAD
jgi:REP element-mobilizing transposase RayT